MMTLSNIKDNLNKRKMAENKGCRGVVFFDKEFSLKGKRAKAFKKRKGFLTKNFLKRKRGLFKKEVKILRKEKRKSWKEAIC